MNPIILIIGSTGFVATQFLKTFKTNYPHILTPSSSDMDITNTKSIEKYISKNQPGVIINFSGFTNLEVAEKDRGNKSGLAWLINTVGARNLAQASINKNIFLIHISTDGVFSGTKDFPGPYDEDIIPEGDPNTLSWYGYTKYMGEQEILASGVNAAIVRISYPFGNNKSEKDFANKIITYIQKDYALFSDQNFTPTFIDDISLAIEKIIQNRISGIYHVVTHPLTTPLEFGEFVANLIGSTKPINQTTLNEYLQKPNIVPRAQFGGLLAKKTQKLLNIEFSNWKQALEKFLIAK